MSLWTPDGERPVNRSNSAGDPGQPAGAATGQEQPAPFPDGASLEDLSPAERARAEEMLAQMAEVQRQILAAPAAQVVANHVMGFYELAALHLAQQEPRLEEARLAIDAMASVLDATEERLGDDGMALRQALGQLQMAFVARSEPGEG